MPTPAARKHTYAEAVLSSDDDDLLDQATANLMAVLASAPSAPLPVPAPAAAAKVMLASQLLGLLRCFDAVPEMIQELERTGQLCEGRGAPGLSC